MQRINLIKKNVNLKYGLGIEYDNYRYKTSSNLSYLEKNSYLNSLQAPSPVVIRDSISFSKNKLALNYITVPLMLNFITNSANTKKGLSLSMGLSAGYLFGVRNKQKSEERGKQTAVEWLVEKLNQCEPMYSGIQSNEHKEHLEKLETILEADIIILGISRTSKTPTTIYLANKGYKSANIPMVPNQKIPEEVLKDKKKTIVGLIADPERLVDIRKNRLNTLSEEKHTSYVDLERIKEELEESRKVFKVNNIPTIDVTRKSVEETAASIIKIHEIKNS